MFWDFIERRHVACTTTSVPPAPGLSAFKKRKFWLATRKLNRYWLQDEYGFSDYLIELSCERSYHGNIMEVGLAHSTTHTNTPFPVLVCLEFLRYFDLVLILKVF